jgi:hypothetical protein
MNPFGCAALYARFGPLSMKFMFFVQSVSRDWKPSRDGGSGS